MWDSLEHAACSLAAKALANDVELGCYPDNIRPAALPLGWEIVGRSEKYAALFDH